MEGLLFCYYGPPLYRAAVDGIRQRDFMSSGLLVDVSVGVDISGPVLDHELSIPL